MQTYLIKQAFYLLARAKTLRSERDRLFLIFFTLISLCAIKQEKCWFFEVCLHRLRSLMVHLYLCLPDRCGQKIDKSKKDRRFFCPILHCLSPLLLCIFCPHRSDSRGINAPLNYIYRFMDHWHKRTQPLMLIAVSGAFIPLPAWLVQTENT